MPATGAKGDGSQDKEVFWTAQIRKVHLGMRQSLAMEYLPQRSEGTTECVKDGATYTFTYALDPHWSVATVYRRSPFRYKNNPYSLMDFPRDKVIALPHLLRAENKLEIGYPAIAPRRK